VKKGRTGWLIGSISIVVISALLWLEINTFWMNISETLEDGVVLLLSQELTETELEYASTNGWEIIEDGKSVKDTYTVLIHQDSEKEIRFNNVADFTAMVFGREIECESLNLTLHKRLLKQFDILFLVFALLPACLWILICIWRKMCEIQQEVVKNLLESIVMILLFSIFLSMLLGAVHIPREFMPKENIFEFHFYIENAKGFLGMADRSWATQEDYLNIKHMYAVGGKLYGTFLVGAWGGTLWLVQASRKWKNHMY
jgi:hypothetical protein